MTTRLANGFPGIICSRCKGCGQERYKSEDLPPEFNATNGRYEGDIFIRKCLVCDGLGAIEDGRAAANVTNYQAQMWDDQYRSALSGIFR